MPEWKRNARTIPSSVYKAAHERQMAEEAILPFNPRYPHNPLVHKGASHKGGERMEMYHGKARVKNTHTRDLVEDGQVVATETFRRGDILFPVSYVHSSKPIYGETKDVRYTSRGWEVYIDAVLRNRETGEVVLDPEGFEIDLSGWYPESCLRPVEAEGVEFVTPGKYKPPIDREPRIERDYDPRLVEDGATVLANDGGDRRNVLRDVNRRKPTAPECQVGIEYRAPSAWISGEWESVTKKNRKYRGNTGDKPVRIVCK